MFSSDKRRTAGETSDHSLQADHGGAFVIPDGVLQHHGVQIDRRADAALGLAPNARDAVAEADHAGGDALPGAVQRKFETSLGADLSGVRVHTGAASDTAARSVSAL